mgnify:CR=1
EQLLPEFQSDQQYADRRKIHGAEDKIKVRKKTS